MDAGRLLAGLAGLGLETGGSRPELLERYIREIELWNPRYGLVAEGEDLIGRHVLDSLAGLDFIRGLNPLRMADIGSGAGFPGIPLAIWMDSTDITLVERSGRRAGFLRSVAATLGLKHVSILESPYETIDPRAADFDVVTFRAWTALDPAHLRRLGRILAPGGVIVAYKGRRDVIDRELSGIEGLTDEVDVRRIEVPELSEERHLVVFRIRGDR